MACRGTWLGLFALGAALLTPHPANAQIIYGDGETIAHVADLPANARDQLGAPAGAAVGYKYWYGHIFWLAVWTSSGEFVVYDGDKFVPVGTDADQAAAACGLPKGALQVPLDYQLPPGWIVIGSLLLVLALWHVWVKMVLISASREKKALVNDPRYVAAAQIIAQGGAAAIPQAIEYLVGQGIPEATARQNLMVVLGAVRFAPAKETPS